MTCAEKAVLDFAWANTRLVWQRQLAFAAGTGLVALHLDPAMALMGCCACQIADLSEKRLCDQVLDDHKAGQPLTPSHLTRLSISGGLSAFSIVLFVIIAAIAEQPSVHIGPLFFLFMASLYSAINTCQLPAFMFARLSIFSIGFVFIPVHDLLIVRPALDSVLWMQLGTSVFVIYFLFECARKFASHYRAVQNKLEELRAHRDRLEEALVVQSQFVSTVSHELRTPLTSVKSALDLINADGVCTTMEEVRRVAGIGQKSSDRLASLIDDLLDFQKLRAGAMTFRMEDLDLRDVVNEAADVGRALAAPRGIALNIRLPEHPVMVTADFDRLLQVMSNILSNAVKYSNAGGSIDIVAMADESRGQISVRDYGIGIPDGAQDRVFAPFAQVDGSDKRAYGGTGLGMSIARRIMDGLDGKIGYTSAAGEGTTFTIALTANEVSRPVLRAEDAVPTVRDLRDGSMARALPEAVT